MTLKVIHLIRKLERIERDIEEIHNLLENLQMDREYSGKLKDSLLEEFHRLKNLKKEILKQKIYVPPEYISYIENLLPEISESERIPNTIEIHSKPPVETLQSKEVIEEKKNQELEKNNSKEIQQKKDSKKINAKPKHSPFLFRFQ